MYQTTTFIVAYSKIRSEKSNNFFFLKFSVVTKLMLTAFMALDAKALKLEYREFAKTFFF